MPEEKHSNTNYALIAVRKLHEVSGTVKCLLNHTTDANVVKAALGVEILTEHAHLAAMRLHGACINEETKGEAHDDV